MIIRLKRTPIVRTFVYCRPFVGPIITNNVGYNRQIEITTTACLCNRDGCLADRTAVVALWLRNDAGHEPQLSARSTDIVTKDSCAMVQIIAQCDSISFHVIVTFCPE